MQVVNLPAPLRQKQPPPPPTKGEQRVLDLLWQEYRKADAAARAAARFEADVHEEIRQRRVAEGYIDEDAGNIQRVFHKEEFNDTFRRLMLLRIESKLISLLGLQDFRDEILQQRIKALFNGDRAKTLAIGETLHIGTPDEQQLLALKHKRR